MSDEQCVMTHPKVPPKSFSFYLCDQSEVEEWCFNLPEECTDFCWGLKLRLANRYERFLIAAAAEVEWRKRAERWQVIWRHLHYRGHKIEFHGHGFYEPGSKRINFADNRISECKHIAQQWRKWGTSK